MDSFSNVNVVGSMKALSTNESVFHFHESGNSEFGSAHVDCQSPGLCSLGVCSRLPGDRLSDEEEDSSGLPIDMYCNRSNASTWEGDISGEDDEMEDPLAVADPSRYLFGSSMRVSLSSDTEADRNLTRTPRSSSTLWVIIRSKFMQLTAQICV